MTDPSAALTAIDEAVAAEADACLRFLAELVRRPSDNPPGDCAPHARHTAGLMRELGFAVEEHPVPDDLVKGAGMISATNLIVRRRFGDGPTVALNAHGDVVPPGEGWSTDPYGAEIRDGWLYGRGAAVSKSDIAAYAFALRALERSGVPLAGAVELHVTYDEETGGDIGPRHILASGLSRPDYAICAGFSYQVVTAHNGCLHLEVTLKGRSAHAALPDSGRDAIAALGDVIGAIYAHGRELARRRSRLPGITAPSCVVGRVAGGINTNVVADRALLRVDRRIIPEEDFATAEAELRAVIERASAAHAGIALEIRPLLRAMPLRPHEAARPLIAAVSRHAERVLGEALPQVAVPLYTDARHYAEAGIPTLIYGAGPRTLLEANGHRADERVPVDTLAIAARVVASALAELLAAQG
ncbi:MAG: M20 family metallopeptidase [Roseovarius sp.]